MNTAKFCALVIVLLSLIELGSALECYVCTNQTDNTEKCLNTIKTCEHDEDVCLSEIRWGSTPYWDFGAPKQFYVSKRCSTKKTCQRIRSHYMPYCTHIWYDDWTCSECCLGDRCNYYVISGERSLKYSISMLMGALSLVVLITLNKY